MVTNQDEEEVQQDLSRLQAKEMAVADQPMIEPAERPRDLTDSIRTQESNSASRAQRDYTRCKASSKAATADSGDAACSAVYFVG